MKKFCIELLSYKIFLIQKFSELQYVHVCSLFSTTSSDDFDSTPDEEYSPQLQMRKKRQRMLVLILYDLRYLIEILHLVYYSVSDNSSNEESKEDEGESDEEEIRAPSSKRRSLENSSIAYSPPKTRKKRQRMLVLILYICIT